MEKESETKTLKASDSFLWCSRWLIHKDTDWNNNTASDDDESDNNDDNDDGDNNDDDDDIHNVESLVLLVFSILYRLDDLDLRTATASHRIDERRRVVHIWIRNCPRIFRFPFWGRVTDVEVSHHTEQQSVSNHQTRKGKELWGLE